MESIEPVEKSYSHIDMETFVFPHPYSVAEMTTDSLFHFGRLGSVLVRLRLSEVRCTDSNFDWPSLVFPEPYILVVPTDTTNYEDGLFKEAHRVKKKLSRVVLPPARHRVFTDCRMMIVVMDEGRHEDGVLLYNCQHLMKDFFKFYREGGNE